MIDTKKYDDIISQYDGIITPDSTITIGMLRCIQAASTYMNRAIGYYEQCRGISVIPNVRWGDPSTYDFCFLGIPKNSVVALSTHGAIAKDTSNQNLLRKIFKDGLRKMLEVLEPTDVLVYGYMPPDIFGYPFSGKCKRSLISLKNKTTKVVDAVEEAGEIIKEER